MWVNLISNLDGFAFIELINETSATKITITALTKNIIGIQSFALTNSSKVALGPGETFEYGYKIEIFRVDVV